MTIDMKRIRCAMEDAKREALEALEKHAEDGTWFETVCRIFYALITVLGAETVELLAFIAFLTGQIGLEQLCGDSHAAA